MSQHGLSLGMKGHEVVKLHGEPDSKSGGQSRQAPSRQASHFVHTCANGSGSQFKWQSWYETDASLWASTPQATNSCRFVSYYDCYFSTLS